MKAKNLTAKQFAEEIGVQPSGMSHILSGRNKPSLDFVMKVINRFPEIDINWLLNGNGEMYALSPRLANPAKVSTLPPSYQQNTAISNNAPYDNAPSMQTSAVKSVENAAAQEAQTIANNVSNNLTLFDTFEDTNIGQKTPATPAMAQSTLQSNSRTEMEAAESRFTSAEEHPRVTMLSVASTRPTEPSKVDKTVVQEQPTVKQADVTNHNDATTSSSMREIRESTAERSSEVKNSTQNVKKITKVIVLYEDHTFSEYYPE